MAENDTSWHQRDNSWRKRTVHDSSGSGAALKRYAGQATHGEVYQQGSGAGASLLRHRVAAKYTLKILLTAPNIQGINLSMIERRQELDTIKKLLKRNPIVGIIGARQVGKTTLAQQFAKKTRAGVIYYDLENPEDEARLADPMDGGPRGARGRWTRRAPTPVRRLLPAPATMRSSARQRRLKYKDAWNTRPRPNPNRARR